MMVIYVFALSYLIGLFIIQLARGKKELPTRYGFQVMVNQYYEIFYIVQCFYNVLIILHAVTGYDNLFYVLCSNVIAQFILLKNTFKNIDKHRGFDRDQSLRKCIRHHNKLLRYITRSRWGVLVIAFCRFCDEMESIFGITTLAQFALSLIALCVSSLFATRVSLQALYYLYNQTNVVGKNQCFPGHNHCLVLHRPYLAVFLVLPVWKWTGLPELIFS